MMLQMFSEHIILWEPSVNWDIN